MAQTDISVVGSTLIAVGLSQVIRVSPSAYQYSQSIKIVAGGGTLEIVSPQLSGTSTGAGSAWGKGYPLGSSEVYNISGGCVFYLAATGATMTAGMILGYTAGASTP